MDDTNEFILLRELIGPVWGELYHCDIQQNGTRKVYASKTQKRHGPFTRTSLVLTALTAIRRNQHLECDLSVVLSPREVTVHNVRESMRDTSRHPDIYKYNLSKPGSVEELQKKLREIVDEHQLEHERQQT
jgi:hypothetical protein